jgi:hypothetical protein
MFLNQETNMADKEIISSLKEENEFLKQVSNDYENLRYDNLYLTYNWHPRHRRYSYILMHLWFIQSRA